VSTPKRKAAVQLDREIADALQSRVKLTIDDTYRPWRELQIRAHVNGKEVGYLDLQLTPQGVPYPSMVSVDPAVRRRGVATLLYQEAARLAEERFDHPLHSDVDRSGSDDAFWQKQTREGRAECVRERTPPRDVPFDHIVKGRSGCVRYRLARKAVPR
jgi:GNAT superfamily N-acetyltransferase